MPGAPRFDRNRVRVLEEPHVASERSGASAAPERRARARRAPQAGAERASRAASSAPGRRFLHLTLSSIGNAAATLDSGGQLGWARTITTGQGAWSEILPDVEPRNASAKAPRPDSRRRAGRRRRLPRAAPRSRRPGRARPSRRCPRRARRAPDRLRAARPPRARRSSTSVPSVHAIGTRPESAGVVTGTKFQACTASTRAPRSVALLDRPAERRGGVLGAVDAHDDLAGHPRILHDPWPAARPEPLKLRVPSADFPEEASEPSAEHPCVEPGDALRTMRRSTLWSSRTASSRTSSTSSSPSSRSTTCCSASRTPSAS